MPDSGGAGEHRGGLGVECVVRARAEITLNTSIERKNCLPWGLEGGLEGAGNEVLLRRDGEIGSEAPNAKLYSTGLIDGDAFILRSGGGGGFGSPLKRTAAKVLDDVRSGYVTIESARRYYGVVINSGSMLVDTDATIALRAEIAATGQERLSAQFTQPPRRLTAAQRAKRQPGHLAIACLLPGCCGGRPRVWQAVERGYGERLELTKAGQVSREGKKMAASPFKKVDVINGPFDPGGQPDTHIGQPLELGFFAWNIKGGMTASKAVLKDPPRYQNFWEWPNSMRLVQLAEQIGFDYQVPFGRWIGQGGVTDYNGAALDFLASAAATAPITSRIGLFSTAHITYRFHPLHIAKFGATIDHISNGRWGLNIVSGYSAKEMAAFGFKQPIPHDEAYAMADEFVCLMKHLWHEEERFDFEGKYYQSYGAMIAPRPTRRPRPVLMNAGASDRGIDFAARHSDWIFATMPTLEGYSERVNFIHNLAAKYRRKVRCATMIWVVPEATDQLAQEKYDWIKLEIDHEAVLNFLASMQGTSAEQIFGLSNPENQDPWGGIGKQAFVAVALGITAPHVVGSYETVAEKLRAFHGTGLESLLFCFFDPQQGLHQMQDHIIPILKKMGLRH